MPQQSDSPAVLNPAYYPYWRKPEILWSDADREEAAADEAAGDEPEVSYGIGWK